MSHLIEVRGSRTTQRELERELLLVSSMNYMLEYGGLAFLELILSIKHGTKKEKFASVPFDHNDVVSLDASFDEESDGDSLVDVVAGKGLGPAQIFEAQSNRDVLDDVLSELSPREQEVIARRFGLRGYQPHTLEEVAYYLTNNSSNTYRHRDCLTRERVRQIEAKALRNLRIKLRNRQLSRDAF